MKKLFLIVPLAVVFACSGQKKEENSVEKVTLESFKDKLSFSLGALNGKSILNAKQPNVLKLDKELVIEGFNENFNTNDVFECEATLKGLFGERGQDFDTTYLESGSKCFGRMTSANLFRQIEEAGEMPKFNPEMLKKGFEQGLTGVDSVNFSWEDQESTMKEYTAEMEAKMRAEQEAKAKIFWEDVLKKDVKEIDGTGVYIETLKAGKGGSPEVIDDVEAHYTLFDTEGNKIESSLDRGEPLKMNLGGLIQGWQIGFPAMKKGGKYNLYVPSDKAYGRGALRFEIEFINYGKAGTIAPPRMQMPPQH